MKIWISNPYGYTPLLSAPDVRARKVNGVNLNPNTVLDVIGEEGAFFYCKRETDNGAVFGYVEKSKTNEYVEPLPRDCVDLSDIQTPSVSDFLQYVVWGNQIQYNMCGEICAAYLLGCSLSDLLVRWREMRPKAYQRVFRTGVAGGTGKEDLQTIFDTFNVPSVMFSGVQYPFYTPDLLDMLTGAIVSARISKSNGRLRGSGILHWVVVTGQFRDRCGYGSVSVFNPAQNRVEQYSYSEFVASTRQPFGIKKQENHE